MQLPPVIYRATGDLKHNRPVAQRTEDPRVIRLTPPRRRIRRADYSAPVARQAVA